MSLKTLDVLLAGYSRLLPRNHAGRSVAKRPRSGARSLLGLPFPDVQAALYSMHFGSIG
jgi:hypothetical protein